MANSLKVVSVEQLEHSLAQAISGLMGEDYTVCVRDVEYDPDGQGEGAWFQLQVAPELNPLFKSLFEEKA